MYNKQKCIFTLENQCCPLSTEEKITILYKHVLYNTSNEMEICNNYGNLFWAVIAASKIILNIKTNPEEEYC